MSQSRKPKDQIACAANAPLVSYFQEQVAKKKQFGNEPISFAYSKALKSIRNCPLPISSGKHAREIKLEGIGPAMEKQIDTALSLVHANFTTDSITDDEFSSQANASSDSIPQSQISLAAQLRRDPNYFSNINARTANLVAVEFPSTVQSLITVRCITTTEERLAHGKDYFKKKHVTSATIRENSDPNSGFEVDAFVKGSKPDPYYVVLQLDRQKTFLRSVCEECIQHSNIVGVCKHAIAVLYSCSYGTITVDNSNWKSPAAKITRRQTPQTNNNVTTQTAQPPTSSVSASLVQTQQNTSVSRQISAPSSRSSEPAPPDHSSENSGKRNFSEIPMFAEDNSVATSRAKPNKKKKDYIDSIRRRSGPWAIVMALYDKHPAALSEYDLKLTAQPLCDAPFERVGAIDPTQPSSFYSAFSCVTKLSRERNLVKIARKPKMYSLTEDGVKFAQVLHEREYNPNYRSTPPTDVLTSTTVPSQSTTTKTTQKNSQKPPQAKTKQTSSAPSQTISNVQQPLSPFWRDLNEISQDEDDIIDLTPPGSQVAQQPCQPLPRPQQEIVFLDSDSEDEDLSDKENRNPKSSSNIPQPQPSKPVTDRITTSSSSFPAISGKTFQQNYEVVLIVDLNERFDAEYSVEDLRRRLQSIGVALEQKRLSVGDYLWVARQTSSQLLTGSEIVLDYIAERKKISTYQRWPHPDAKAATEAVRTD